METSTLWLSGAGSHWGHCSYLEDCYVLNFRMPALATVVVISITATVISAVGLMSQTSEAAQPFQRHHRISCCKAPQNLSESLAGPQSGREGLVLPLLPSTFSLPDPPHSNATNPVKAKLRRPLTTNKIAHLHYVLQRLTGWRCSATPTMTPRMTLGQLARSCVAALLSILASRWTECHLILLHRIVGSMPNLCHLSI